MSTKVELTAADGHTLSAYVAEPGGKPLGGVVIVQEIFGVNSHIRAVADGYAKDGYLAVAPALFDRVARGYETGYTPPDIEKGLEFLKKINFDQMIADVAAAADYAGSAGKVGVVGFCLGGTLAWVASARVPGLAAAVGYYGGYIPNFITEQPKVPVLLHFGEQDKSPSPEQAREVLKAHPEVTAHFYEPAGHGFNCDQRGSYHEASARLARERSLAFLRAHLG